MEEFALRLKKARKMRNFTQRYVSEKTGLSQTAIHQWEAGNARPNVEAVKKLIELYECSADYLFGLTDYRRLRKNVM